MVHLLTNLRFVQFILFLKVLLFHHQVLRVTLLKILLVNLISLYLNLLIFLFTLFLHPLITQVLLVKAHQELNHLIKIVLFLVKILLKVL